MFGALVGLQLRETVKSVFFGVIVLAGVLFIASTAPAIGKLYGTPTYPVTRQVITVVAGSFAVFILVVLTLYAGELVWRERDAGMAQIYDALPTPRWAVVAAKLTALLGIVGLLLAVVVVSGIVIQAAKGFFHFELGLYLRSVYGISFVLFACLCSLAVLVHVLIDQKYIGHFAMVVFLAVSLLLPVLGVEHHLLRYGSVPAHPYSDMNGYGHFVAPLAWFELYWLALALALAVVASLFWVRGTPRRSSERWREARGPAGPALRSAARGGAGRRRRDRRLHLLQHQRPEPLPDSRLARGAPRRSTRRGTRRASSALPLPQGDRVKTRGRHLPRRAAGGDRRGVHARQPHRRNRSTRRGASQLPRPPFAAMTFPGGQRVAGLRRTRLGVHAYRLAQPLAPGASSTLAFARQLRRTRGFENDGQRHPHRGQRHLRQRRVPARPRLPAQDGARGRRRPAQARARAAGAHAPDLDDPRRRRNNYISHDADWITFDATVSTTPTRSRVAPGYLQREWTEGGRRYFHYEMDAPILNFFAFQSARYAVKRDRWNDVAHRDLLTTRATSTTSTG